MDDDREELTGAEQAQLEEKCADPLLYEIALSVVFGDLDACVAHTREAVEKRGLEPLTVMNRGFIAGMDIVGPRFRDGEMFVPEVLTSVRAMKGGVAVLSPLLLKGGMEPIGTVVLGTVNGDLHDVGKNLVAMMLEGANFKVIDIGIDQKPEAFVAAIREHRPAIVGMSAMLTTTMMNMATAIEAIRAAGMRDEVRIMVGGAPVNAVFAEKIGADAYGNDSSDAVVQAKRLMACIGTQRPAHAQ
jgi:5-methyltetrahydrofolate--homocysteine methyltransferase